MGTYYAYSLLNTDNPNNAKQQILDFTSECGVVAVFVEDVVHGKVFDRPLYTTLRQSLVSEDILILKELNHLGRTTKEVYDEWLHLYNRGVMVMLLDTPKLSTHGVLEPKLVFEIVSELLAYNALKDREKLQQSIKEGMLKAKIDGKHIGRRGRKDTIPENFTVFYNKIKNKDIQKKEAAELLGWHRLTLDRYLTAYEELHGLNK